MSGKERTRYNELAKKFNTLSTHEAKEMMSLFIKMSRKERCECSRLRRLEI